MAETSTSSATRGGNSQRGGGRGNRRGYWRHRNRGGRGGASSTANATTTEGSQPEQREQEQSVANAPEPVAARAPPIQPSSVAEPFAQQDGQSARGGRSGRGGRGGGGGRRGRGGGAQRSIVISHRGGRAPPAGISRISETSLRPAADDSAQQAGLSAVAAEFVPRQPVTASSSRAPKSKPPKPTPAPLRVAEKSTAEDLPTRIHEDIDNGQYECVICTNEVVRTSKVWSCSICWTVLHIHCVKKWYKNQMEKKKDDPQPDQIMDWRCPGCNSNLVEEPGSYHCWCGKEIDMKPISGLPPHTCGNTCSKPRATCPHPCPLMCHAGPCPPCTLMGPTQTCFCGKHEVTRRCSETDYAKGGWSCHEECGDLLPCGEHTCSQPCHSGLCGACKVPMPAVCYCGKEEKVITCDQRDDVLDSFNYGQLQPSTADEAQTEEGEWFEGSFKCQHVCDRPFDCGKHTCQRPCHSQDEETAHCPFSPDVVTHCNCGKTSLESMSIGPRASCEDPVPHCDKPCGKAFPCGHFCPEKCHVGACPPCFQYIDVSCRCGKVTARSVCHQGTVEQPQCFRTCRAQLNCGRHECGARCCPGEKKASERRKQKRTANENFEPEHICLQVCGRQLKCGTHTCQQLCHRGPCMACPEAIFEEISCSCGRTVLHPPQPCGTRPPECRFNCRRPRSCGHPMVDHQCHSDDVECPKCPFLVERSCICGKKVLKNQPCWFEEARCGLPCGKKLKCGLHECKKPCHKPGECEDVGVPGKHCSQICGRTMVSCEHTCADQCHAPYPCKEDKPCQSKTFITCPCQRRKQEVRCQATRFNPWPHKDTTLKCDEECLRIQRNQLLAAALKVDPESHKDDHIPYSDKTLKLFCENISWSQTQEREFRVFASSKEKRLRFKPMQPHQRAFLHSLAEDYGLDSESQDPEGHRHVCIFKTPRFVAAPQKTLAQCLRLLQANKPALVASPSPQPVVQAFNALLLANPRFGLTVDEVEKELSKDLATASRSGPALTFQTSFLPSDEILIKAVPNFTAASIMTSTPQTIESALTALKASISKTIWRNGGGIARNVILCHADDSLIVLRREGGDSSANTGGWNAVASRGAKRAVVGPKASSSASGSTAKLTLGGLGNGRAGGAFVALRRLELRKKKEAEEKAVVDDWEKEVEREEKEASGKEEEKKGESSGSGSEKEEEVEEEEHKSEGSENRSESENEKEAEAVQVNGTKESEKQLEMDASIQEEEEEPQQGQAAVALVDA
ncbi:hypothetical protein QBC43DRAFT_244540 [Cladorrhinum sp. PSN259]|nr:hypothetical protein QBC43DRAFT_244540 [Cladorrhinum sp. PSN259]